MYDYNNMLKNWFYIFWIQKPLMKLNLYLFLKQEPLFESHILDTNLMIENKFYKLYGQQLNWHRYYVYNYPGPLNFQLLLNHVHDINT